MLVSFFSFYLSVPLLSSLSLSLFLLSFFLLSVLSLLTLLVKKLDSVHAFFFASCPHLIACFLPNTATVGGSKGEPGEVTTTTTTAKPILTAEPVLEEPNLDITVTTTTAAKTTTAATTMAATMTIVVTPTTTVAASTTAGGASTTTGGASTTTTVAPSTTTGGASTTTAVTTSTTAATVTTTALNSTSTTTSNATPEQNYGATTNATVASTIPTTSTASGTTPATTAPSTTTASTTTTTSTTGVAAAGEDSSSGSGNLTIAAAVGVAAGLFFALLVLLFVRRYRGQSKRTAVGNAPESASPFTGNTVFMMHTKDLTGIEPANGFSDAPAISTRHDMPAEYSVLAPDPQRSGYASQLGSVTPAFVPYSAQYSALDRGDEPAIYSAFGDTRPPSMSSAANTYSALDRSESHFSSEYIAVEEALPTSPLETAPTYSTLAAPSTLAEYSALSGDHTPAMSSSSATYSALDRSDSSCTVGATGSTGTGYKVTRRREESLPVTAAYEEPDSGADTAPQYEDPTGFAPVKLAAQQPTPTALSAEGSAGYMAPTAGGDATRPTPLGYEDPASFAPVKASQGRQTTACETKPNSYDLPAGSSSTFL